MTIASTLRNIPTAILVTRVQEMVGRECRTPNADELGDTYLNKVVQVFAENLPEDETDIKVHVKKRNDERWGVDTDSVIPYKAAETAVNLGLLRWEYKPESTVSITAALVLVHQLKVYTKALVTVLCEAAIEAYEEGPEMAYIAIINVPGYLPMADEPAEFETIAEGWAYLAEERLRGEHESEEFGESATATELRRRSEEDEPKCDAVYGPTPGYDGGHDLGLVYSVTLQAEGDSPWRTA